jgi:hypothetical protein
VTPGGMERFPVVLELEPMIRTKSVHSPIDAKKGNYIVDKIPLFQWMRVWADLTVELIAVRTAVVFRTMFEMSWRTRTFSHEQRPFHDIPGSVLVLMGLAPTGQLPESFASTVCRLRNF